MLHKIDNPLDAVELKFDGERSFSGYASVFGRVDSYGDTVVKGAFADTLDNGHRIKMFFQHSPASPIGVWREIAEDDHGLRVTGELTPGNSVAQDVYASMKHGAIDGLSIGFRLPEGFDEHDEGRILKKIHLVEISVVSMPAEQHALIDSVRSEIDSIERLSDAEHFLRDAGMFTRAMATAFVSQVRTIIQRDADQVTAEQIEALQRQADMDWLRNTLKTTLGR